MIIRINGKECSCERGEYLLQVAKRNDVFIPTICYHEGLGGLGGCRVCLVEVVDGGRSQIVVSCIYPVEKEIEVFTDSEKVREERGVVLALLSRLAPYAKIVKQLSEDYGVEVPRLTNKEGGLTCILCGRCTTACELVGSGAIAKVNRGITKEINTPYAHPSDECIGCASCAHVCPTNSIFHTEDDTSVTIWGKTFELRRCECCGNTISTDELIANALHKAEGDEMILCMECRKALLADKIRQGSTKSIIR